MASDGQRVTYKIQDLKNLRVDLGLNKSELGRLAGVSARTISNAEKDGIREETAKKIVAALQKFHKKEGRPEAQIEVKSVKKPKKKKKKKDEI